MYIIYVLFNALKFTLLFYILYTNEFAQLKFIYIPEAAFVTK